MSDESPMEHEERQYLEALRRRAGTETAQTALTRSFAFSYQGDWWWIAAHIEYLIDRDLDARTGRDVLILRWERETTPGQMIFKGYLDTGEWVLHLAVSGEDGKTRVQFSDSAPMIGFLQPIIKQIRIVAERATALQRQANGPRYEDLLIQFYAARRRQESPKLSEMARAAGVSYTALRQYKVKFDKRLKGKV